MSALESLLAPWAIYTMLTLIAWGLWGFFSAVAERRLGVKSVFAWHCIGIGLCAAAAAPFVGVWLPHEQIALCILGGAGYAQGAMWMVDSISAGGPGGIVVTVTAMYPVVTVLLNCIVLGQAVTPSQIGGIMLAAVSLCCFMETDDLGTMSAPGKSSAMRWLGLCVLSLIGYAMWTFAAEVCVMLPFAKPVPSTVQGRRLAWQAVGCLMVFALHRPALRTPPPHGHMFVGELGRIRSSSSHLASPAGSTEALLNTEHSRHDSSDSVDSTALAAGLRMGVCCSLAMGVAMALGSATFLLAVESAPSRALAAIVMLTGMYGVVTTLLLWLLMSEKLSLRRWFGILLAVAAGALLA
eukprot:TRINITY_DN66435_c0_g1_i1.p1 TRINITY_DN66435_c0_g1~~TRINITY_DN66435_c0_g1_i1.p1  ORF type:complete len:353 (-),score=29.47 TRINITY_DN66435_c0_g1_i1:183-1241(-)